MWLDLDLIIKAGDWCCHLTPWHSPPSETYWSLLLAQTGFRVQGTACSLPTQAEAAVQICTLQETWQMFPSFSFLLGQN